MNRLATLFLLTTLASPARAADDFPLVPDDLEVSLFARDPLVRNPCAITFDAMGRLCVGMGPQYRNPKPDTPGDSVWILLDEDRDGVAEGRRKFATGFNCIQGLAWRGNELWIANAPDLTVVRDLDGDEVADEYVRLYTDLGNLEHGLHGLNWGPDGKLYMSKGNSSGLVDPPDHIPPKPFRELWARESTAGLLDFPEPVTFTDETYQKNYHDPRDYWGLSGGILRCNPDGSKLEIVSRGFRNPFDICFDDGFDWLGTDNDQTMGDKIFAPFYGAHFGWGHPWSYDWKGDDHLPSAPSAGPLFEGSGAGVIYLGLSSWPERYRGAFLINDWLKRKVYIYRPQWKGAWMQSAENEYDILAEAGGPRKASMSTGRSFDPVDIEVGPDGALYISSWGREYGAKYVDGQFANEGRIYRIRPKGVAPVKWSATNRDPGKNLGSHLPAWRTNAQEELVRRGDPEPLLALLNRPDLPKATETWALWTLGRIAPEKAWDTGNLNRHIQSLRIQRIAKGKKLRDEIRAAITRSEPRLRHEAVLVIHQKRDDRWIDDLLQLLASESDRIVYYSTWKALIDLLPQAKRKKLLADQRPPVRRGILLGLLEEDALSDDELRPLLEDRDQHIVSLVTKRIGGKDATELRGSKKWAIRPRPNQKSRPLSAVSLIRSESGKRYYEATLATGARAYSDRKYVFTSIPAELDGETFIQSANNDADPASGTSVSLTFRYPTTVFLADDVRGEKLPTWARASSASGGFAPTGLFLETTDAKHRLFRAEFPAGEATFGPNRAGVKARKSNFILILQPQLLDPPAKATTLEEVLPLLASADPERGRSLYLSKRAANCAACHQLEGRGNVHAPDLAGIGERADPQFLIRSILDPSATITEGFAMQILTTKSGTSPAGIILEETGRAVKVAMVDGSVVTVPTADITRRETAPVSAMPPTFAGMLTPQDVADITAYLLAGKGTKGTQVKAKESADGEFAFRRDGIELQLFLGSTRVATYLLDHETLTRRAFVNVHTPSGIPVTRTFPPVKGVDIMDHDTMHPGIWMSFGWIDGNDYWRLQSKVKFEKFLEDPAASGKEAAFATRDRYLDRDGSETVCVQDTSYRFRRVPEGIRLDWDAKFHNNAKNFTFGDQEESGLAIRVASPLRVQGGKGRIFNNRGDQNGAGTWGKEFRWIDYSGTVDGKRAGLLVIPHPENPRPSWSHSRDYGVLVSNPFPRQPRERREPYVTTIVKKGELFRLRYTVLIHESDDEEFDPAEVVKSLQP